MKNLRFLLAAVFAWIGVTVAAQDFSDPKYAKWGDTPEQRKENILASNYLKEMLDNRNYDAAAGYYRQLAQNCPQASEATFIRGATIYSNKARVARTDEEKRALIDTLMQVYDLRVQNFPASRNYGKAYVLDRKAREYMSFAADDREGIRRMYREAVDAGIETGYARTPEVATVYFANLCEDYRNDLVYPDEVIEEYGRLLPVVEAPSNEDYKKQIDAVFASSGAANCENLEQLFKAQIEAAPDNIDLLEQAVVLMDRAHCDSDFFLTISERFHEQRPSARTAMMLAQGFQEKGDYNKATKYLREALVSENDPAEQEKLYLRISMVELAANRSQAAAEAARQVRQLNPDNAYAHFVLAQTYVSSAANCTGLAKQAVYWAAYDAMAQAVQLMGDQDLEHLGTAKQLMAAYRSGFPTAEECFFQELKEGDRYTVECGLASGVVTTVRPR